MSEWNMYDVRYIHSLKANIQHSINICVRAFLVPGHGACS